MLINYSPIRASMNGHYNNGQSLHTHYSSVCACILCAVSCVERSTTCQQTASAIASGSSNVTMTQRQPTTSSQTQKMLSLSFYNQDGASLSLPHSVRVVVLPLKRTVDVITW